MTEATELEMIMVLAVVVFAIGWTLAGVGMWAWESFCARRDAVPELRTRDAPEAPAHVGTHGAPACPAGATRLVLDSVGTIHAELEDALRHSADVDADLATLRPQGEDSAPCLQRLRSELTEAMDAADELALQLKRGDHDLLAHAARV